MYFIVYASFVRIKLLMMMMISYTAKTRFLIGLHFLSQISVGLSSSSFYRAAWNADAV